MTRPFRGNTARPREGPDPSGPISDMLASEGWRYAQEALRQKQRAILLRCATRKYATVEQIETDQAEYRVLDQLLRKPDEYLMPRESDG